MIKYICDICGREVDDKQEGLFTTEAILYGVDIGLISYCTKCYDMIGIVKDLMRPYFKKIVNHRNEQAMKACDMFKSLVRELFETQQSIKKRIDAQCP